MNQIATIAGGVIAVYVILALIVSQVVEWINTGLNLRGRLLYAGIVEMFSARNAGADSPGAQLVRQIYSHPLIGNLGVKSLPSYIGPRTFTVSLIASLRDLQAQPGKSAPQVPDLSADGDALLLDLQTRVAAVLPASDPLRKSLGLIIEQTENDYDSVLKAIDAWFEAQMDRISGTFKRYAAYFQIALAFIVVYFLHIDTFALIASLSKSGAAQSAIAAAQNTPNGAVASAIQALVDNGIIPSDAFSFAVWTPHSAREVFGVVLTWFAILLGAPFWFDVLKQIVPIRLSGAKPDAQAAAKGDKQAVVPRLADTTAAPANGSTPEPQPASGNGVAT